MKSMMAFGVAGIASGVHCIIVTFNVRCLFFLDGIGLLGLELLSHYQIPFLAHLEMLFWMESCGIASNE